MWGGRQSSSFQIYEVSANRTSPAAVPVTIATSRTRRTATATTTTMRATRAKAHHRHSWWIRWMVGVCITPPPHPLPVDSTNSSAPRLPHPRRGNPRLVLSTPRRLRPRRRHRPTSRPDQGLKMLKIRAAWRSGWRPTPREDPWVAPRTEGARVIRPEAISTSSSRRWER